MKKVIIQIGLLFCFFVVLKSVVAQPVDSHHHDSIEDLYYRVKIYTDVSGKRIEQLAQLGICLDHAIHKRGCWVQTEIHSTELALLKKAGFSFEILENNLESFYEQTSGGITPKKTVHQRQQQRTAGGDNLCAKIGDYARPSNFRLGSMGGYYSYDEILATLDTMAARYPNLITRRAVIDSGILTAENRPIYWVKVSDNPNLDEAAEPEVLYTALHHAREPVSVSNLIYYLWYLLENYATDQEVKYIVDNTALYFIPCINPDGYVYNFSRRPNGGGMWRKNRRINGDNTFGVDLNRNYAYQWGFNNEGSSPNSNSDTYRGPAAFSEPETQNIRKFCRQRRFLLALNYHSFSNLIVHPWGYDEKAINPDEALFVAFADALSSENDYRVGTGTETVGYTTNGDSDDWMYGEQSEKNKIFSLTPEIGEPRWGFWPPATEIERLCRQVLRQNLLAPHLVLSYARIRDAGPELITQKQGRFYFDIQRLGLLPTGTDFTVYLRGSTTQFDFIGGEKRISGMALLEKRIDSISYALTQSLSPGTEINFEWEISNGVYSYRVPVRKVFGNINTLFSSSCEQITDFGAISDWRITTEAWYSAPASITDSPNSDYSANSTLILALPDMIDLSTAQGAVLRFKAKWEFEPGGYDYAQVVAFNDRLPQGLPLCGNYTVAGNTQLAPGEPTYGGTQKQWIDEVIDLSPLLGQRFQIVFRLKSDEFVQADGMYVDDILLETIDNNFISTVQAIGWGNKNKAVQLLPPPIPSPTTGQVYIPYDAVLAGGELEICTLAGQVVAKQHLPADGHYVQPDLGNLPAGCYFYRIIGLNGQNGWQRLTIVR
jgi:hypothetical protein